MAGIKLSLLGPKNYEVPVNKKVINWHIDQILKNTESTSREAMDLEQAEVDNNFDFPSFSDKYNSLPDYETSHMMI